MPPFKAIGSQLVSLRIYSSFLFFSFSPPLSFFWIVIVYYTLKFNLTWKFKILVAGCLYYTIVLMLTTKNIFLLSIEDPMSTTSSIDGII
jgi:hypothetical protein